MEFSAIFSAGRRRNQINFISIFAGVASTKTSGHVVGSSC